MEQVPAEGDISEVAFDVPPEHILLSSRGKGWHGIDIAEIIHPLDDFALPAIPRHVLVVNLGSPTEISERLIGREGHLGTGGLVILPAGAPSSWHLERRGEVRHLHLYLSPALIHQVAAAADLNPDTVELINATGVADPQIEAMALSFLSELRSGGLFGKLYIESLTNILVITLLRHHSSLKQPLLPPVGGLASTTKRRVVTYIEDHLAGDLSLSALAVEANLSPCHFARLFKESTGLTPHQYVISRRVERAQLLLATTNWSLTTIAHAVGFAQESHLALHFKRLTGFTPKHAR